MANFEVRIRIAQSLAEIHADAWNNCAGGYTPRPSVKEVDEVEVTARDNSSTE
ncbi:MAG: hypothetical protein WB019_23095 [Pseudolabrys sp.]